MRRRETRNLSVPLYFTPMHKLIKEGESGDVKIIHFDVNERESVELLTNQYHFIPPGKYVELTIDEKSVMSDIPYEHYTNLNVVRKARGDVLIAGLGIGLILTRILPKKDVESVAIIEKNPHVIRLVSPCLERYFTRLWSKAQVINMDAFEYKPQAKSQAFDCIYTDIQFPHGKHVTARKMLDRRLKRFLRPGGWIGHWEGIETRVREAIEKGL